MKLSELHLKILRAFRDKQCYSNDDTPNVFTFQDDETPCIRYDDLEEATGTKRAELSPIVKGLRNDKIIQLVMTVDHDYQPCGSGYILTEIGADLINHLAAGKDAESFSNTLLK